MPSARVHKKWQIIWEVSGEKSRKTCQLCRKHTRLCRHFNINKIDINAFAMYQTTVKQVIQSLTHSYWHMLDFLWYLVSHILQFCLSILAYFVWRISQQIMRMCTTTSCQMCCLYMYYLLLDFGGYNIYVLLCQNTRKPNRIWKRPQQKQTSGKRRLKKVS